MSSTMEPSRSDWARITFPAASGSITPQTMPSALPRMAVRGVRSSWDTFWKNTACFRLDSSRAVTMRFMDPASWSNSTSRKRSSRGSRSPSPMPWANSDRVCTGAAKDRAIRRLSRMDRAMAARMMASRTRLTRVVRAVRAVTST